jgi:hypothetical protein
MNDDEKQRVMGILRIWNHGRVSDKCLDIYVAYVDDLAFSVVKKAILHLSSLSQDLPQPSAVRRAALGMPQDGKRDLEAARTLGAHNEF